MTRGRKTIEVSLLLDKHERFERAMNDTDREALRVFIESVLFETNNYAGFREDGSMRFYIRNSRTR